MIRRLLPIGLVCLLAACGSSPDATLYVLQATPGNAVQTRPLGVELRRVTIAGYLDRPEIVRGPRDFRLSVDGGAHWGEPLAAMLDRVITEDLVGRLPHAAVFSEAGAISTKPDLVLEVDVQRFDTDPDGAVVLVAQVAVRPEQGTAEATTLRLRQPDGVITSAGQAAAMSSALGALTDEIAQRVAATP
jgi:uncharacterized protein